jgi:hypothetical protein
MPIVHRDTGRIRRKLAQNIRDYMKVNLDSAIMRFLKDHPGIDLDKVDAEALEADLLALRKELAATIKNGMLERKDRESDIMILAMMVAAHREVVDKRSDPDRDRYGGE